MYVYMNALMYYVWILVWRNSLIDGLMNGWINRQMHGYTNVASISWIYGYMTGWINGWMVE